MKHVRRNKTKWQSIRNNKQEKIDSCEKLTQSIIKRNRIIVDFELFDSNKMREAITQRKGPSNKVDIIKKRQIINKY